MSLNSYDRYSGRLLVPVTWNFPAMAGAPVSG